MCLSACVHTEASLLNAGSGGIPGPRRWLLKPDLKEFGKCARGHISGCEQENERWQSDEGRAGNEGGKSILFAFCGPLEDQVRLVNWEGGTGDIRRRGAKDEALCACTNQKEF